MDEISQAQTPNESKKPVVHDPFLADELDVLEAVASLEKKYGKKILTDEQREKLSAARHNLGNLGSTEEKVSIKKLVNDPQKATEVFMFALHRLVERLLIYSYDYCTESEWKNKNAELKGKVVSLFFYIIFGIKEQEMRNWLMGVFIREKSYV